MADAKRDDHEGAVEQTFDEVRRGFQALGRLLHEHQGYLLRIANDELGPAVRARVGGSDVVALTFLKVFAHLNASTSGLMAVESEPHFRAWVRKVLVNALRGEQERAGAAARDVAVTVGLPAGSALADPAPSPSSLDARQERDDRLRRAVAALPEADRLLVRLRFWHDWTFPALDELLNGEATDAGTRAVGRRLDGLFLSLRVADV